MADIKDEWAVQWIPKPQEITTTNTTVGAWWVVWIPWQMQVANDFLGALERFQNINNQTPAPTPTPAPTTPTETPAPTPVSVSPKPVQKPIPKPTTKQVVQPQEQETQKPQTLEWQAGLWVGYWGTDFYKKRIEGTAPKQYTAPQETWKIQNIKPWKYDDMLEIDIATWLYDWTIKQEDILSLQTSKPAKYDQVVRLRNVIDKQNQKNSRLNNLLAEQAKKQTQQIVESKKPSQEIIDIAKTSSNDLLWVYDKTINTPENTMLLDKMNGVDKEITSLQQEKDRLKENIIKEFPTALKLSSLNALIYDRSQDIDRQIQTKMMEKSSIEDRYKTNLAIAKERFWLIKDIVEKTEDRWYKEMLSNMEFSQKKELMDYEMRLKSQYGQFLDKTTAWDSIVYFDPQTREIVWSYSTTPQTYSAQPVSDFFSSFNPVNLNMQGKLWDWTRWQSGLDLQAWFWTPIPSPVSWKVVRAGKQRDWNMAVTIQTDDWVQIAFNHLSSFPVKVWDTINAWTILWKVWNSWNVRWKNGEMLSPKQLKSGRWAHLDFTIKKPDGSFVRPDLIPSFLEQYTRWWQAKPLTKEQKKQRDIIKKDFSSNPFVKEFSDAVSNSMWLLSTLNDPSWPADMASIFWFMKSLDPSSVVKETEFAIAQQSAWVPARTSQRWEQQINWERLTDAQRKQFAEIAKNYMKIRAQNYQIAYDDSIRFLENEWIENPEQHFYANYADKLLQAIDGGWQSLSQEILQSLSNKYWY